MKKSILIFEKNSAEKIMSTNKYAEKSYSIKIRSNFFDLNVLEKVINRIKYILIKNRKNNQLINIILLISSNYIIDKSVFLVLEIIIYDIIKNNGHIKVKLMTSFETNHYGHSFYKQSLLYPFENKYIDKSVFVKNFEKKRAVGFANSKANHFRYFIENNNQKKSFLSTIISEVGMLLKQQNIQDVEYRDNIKEVIGEIVGNALDHSKGDCILDVIVDDVYNSEDKRTYNSIIITNINISELLLYTKLMDNYKNGNLIISDSVKHKLDKAYSTHKNFFNLRYEESDFFTLATFQKYVSTRGTRIENSGTGLTRLIEILQGKSYENLCYVFTGNRILLLVEGIIRVDKHGMVGFNEENNFLNYPPDFNLFSKSPFYLNGTLISLAFII